MIHIISVYISIYVYKCTPKKKWWWPFLGPVDSVDLATTPGGFGLDLVKPSVTCTARSGAALQAARQDVTMVVLMDISWEYHGKIVIYICTSLYI